MDKVIQLVVDKDGDLVVLTANGRIFYWFRKDEQDPWIEIDNYPPGCRPQDPWDWDKIEGRKEKK